MPAYSNNLEQLIQRTGEIIPMEELQKALTRKTEINEEMERTASFAYDNGNTPIPGEDVDYKIKEQLNSINENTALNSLVTAAAIAKAQNEKPKLTPTQKAEQRKQFIDAMMYQQGELYYQQHHYIMDGKTKRAVRKRIERDYDKGRFNKQGVYFEQPQGRKVVRKPKKSKDAQAVQMSNMLDGGKSAVQMSSFL